MLKTVNIQQREIFLKLRVLFTFSSQDASTLSELLSVGACKHTDMPHNS